MTFASVFQADTKTEKNWRGIAQGGGVLKGSKDSWEEGKYIAEMANQDGITVQHPLPNQSECRKIYRYDGIYCESTYQNLQALRKEKSRDAARSRRGKENFEFYELAKLLPLPAAITSQLDKASIIRLTISYLKMRDFANQGDPPWNLRMEGPPPNTSVKVIGAQRRRSPSALAIEVFEAHLGSHILQSLDGFVFALNQEGKFLYISETVSIYLGLSQVELTGSSVFDYVHPGDHVEMAEQLGMKLPPGRGLLSQGTAEDGASSASSSSQSETPEPVESTSPSLLTTDNTLERSFFIRMKSTLTKRGVHIKSSGYKSIRTSLIVGGGSAWATTTRPMIWLGTVRPWDKDTLRRNRPVMISDYMDLTPVDIVGKRCYHFIHAEDVEGIRHSHLDLLNKGQCVTKYYRWMQKNGGYIWIQSSATIAINAKNANEKNIIWVNYLLRCEHRLVGTSPCPRIRNPGTGKGFSSLKTHVDATEPSRNERAFPNVLANSHQALGSQSLLQKFAAALPPLTGIFL
ncbi:neuronal PAS domain-containing protein 3 [Gracilinanus agilis]|uniref:neuronal PAS domain-containing protein 3 n=1 Tax=Gracilinanus agilis TaxID=191870 RepID=UPI001CFD0640|nr:neuronal PAS domain-containing protein 3 [Gracilinanus agilis]